MKRILPSLILPMFLALFAYGQRDGVTNFGASDVHDFDVINLSTLVPSLNLPLVTKSAGPLPGSLYITSPQSCFQTANIHGVNDTFCGGSGVPLAGLFFIPQEMMGMTTNATFGGSPCYIATITELIGADGLSSYQIPATYLSTVCGTYGSTKTVTTTDGTGITATINYFSTNVPPNVTSASNASGWVYTQVSSTQWKVADAFGNAINLSQPATGNGSFTDSLGAVTTTAHVFSSAVPAQYTDTNGNTQPITYTNGTSTTFQPLCANGNAGLSVTPITGITLPDLTSYGFTWETNNGGIDGIIKTLALRTGGTISYTHGSLATSCVGGFVWSSLNRTTADGTTQYSLSINSNNNTITTTVLDPGNNKIVYLFFSNAKGNLLNTITRFQNTGTVASPAYTLLSSTTYCYNASCSTVPTYPITQRDTYQYVGTGSVQMSHRVETYDGYGNTLTDSNTDSITSQVVLTTYVYGTYSGTYPNGSCVALGNTNIHNHICTKTTTVGGTQVAQNIYAYNSNGALTSSIDWLSSTSHLSTNYSPNANGTVASATAPNGQVTTYGYAATGSGGCNDLLQTSSSTTVNSVVISSSKTWDCNGGVVLTTTDPNGNGTVAQYDSMFRPSMTQDQLGNQTTYSYTATTVKITDPAGVVRYVYVDSLGRPTISQTKQSSSSSNYDTVSKAYSWNGTNFQTTTSVPCVQTLDNPCSTVALTSLSNPIAGPISSANANNGTTTYGLNANDTSVTAGPAPSGEHVKTVQSEVDGLGRTKSVCALETSGGTSCGQVMGNSGVLTSSSYSFGTGSSTVTTTRGSQTHTTVTDALGRTTSVQTPEAGTTTNYFDSTISACVNLGFPATQNGDLVAKTDANGNSLCYAYDGLHRLVQISNSSGSTTANPCVYLRYDSTSVGSLVSPPTGYPTSGANIVGRVVEAITMAPCTPNYVILTDEWFSYDKNGRMTDMWELTPHSGGYYHTSVVYNPNGTISALNGIPGYTGYTFGVDGEGRPNSASQGSTVIINGTNFQYDAASRPLTVPVGTSGDSDTFTYDATEKMKTYTFSVNGKSQAGTLTWNPNGTLGQLSITDTFNAGGSQTCNYLYDDVGRLGIPPNSPPPPPTPTQYSVDCGSGLWRQVFSYDQYDNLTKTGNPGTSWNPGYDSNNHMIGSSYDADGHLLYDGVNTYSWNVYGKMSGVRAGATPAVCGTSGFCATYDALGRIVESSQGATYKEFLFGPTGRLAKMNGQSVSESVVPLPGGLAIRRLGTGGNNIIFHNDWLGTTRLTSLLSTRSWVWDSAFTPYGETYDTYGNGTPTLDFTGDFQDIFAGLFDTPNRELATNASRWLSPDPAGASWNAYAYPTDPNRMTDASGLSAEWGAGSLSSTPPDCGATGSDVNTQCSRTDKNVDPGCPDMACVTVTAVPIANQQTPISDWRRQGQFQEITDAMERLGLHRPTRSQDFWERISSTIGLVGGLGGLGGRTVIVDDVPTVVDVTAAADPVATVEVTEKGLATVADHLAQFGQWDHNDAMTFRLQELAKAGQPATGADANFYLHELYESELMSQGVSQEEAHKAALKYYNVSPYSLYPPEVIQAHPSMFNNNWRAFWGLPLQ